MFRAGKLILHFLRRTGSYQFPGVWEAVINQADVSSHACMLRSALTHTWFDMQREDSVCLGEETLPDSNYFHTNIFSLPPPVAILPDLTVSLDGGGHWLLISCFFFFYHRPRRLSHGWISFSGFLCRRMFKRREKKRGLAVFEVSTQSLPFGIFDVCVNTKC